MVWHNCKDGQGRSLRRRLGIGFIAIGGSRRIYIHCAWSLEDAGTLKRKTASIRRVPGSFRKMVLVNGAAVPWVDGDGIEFRHVQDFLLQGKIAS